MKTITKQILEFTITAFVLSVSFRILLSFSIENKLNFLGILTAILYGSLMFVAGWYFGQKEKRNLPILDIGFRYHLITFLIHNGVSILWFSLGLSSKFENLNSVISTTIYWSPLLIIHFVCYLLIKKKTVDGLNKENIFD